MSWLSISVLIYAILMAGGGIGGYVAAKSVPSLLTGLISGVTLLTAAKLSVSQPRVGFGLAAITALALTAVFIKRYIDTQKPMPSLGLVGASVLMLGLLIFGHFMTNRGE